MSLMATTQPTTDRDIWSHILRYFAINLVADDKEDIQLKRRTILATARTHSDLAAVSLNELWKSMVSLEPIVHIINEASGSTPALKYHKNMGIWEISSLSNGTNFYSRAHPYLSRIQYLHLAKFPSQGDSTLLSAISTLIQSSPICPNLRKIFLGPGLETPGMIYNITPLISPSLQYLQSITFANTLSSGCTDAAIPPLLHLFPCSGVEHEPPRGPREISYRGPISPLIVQTISAFSTLRSISLQPSEPPATGGDIQSLDGLENLTRLDVHLGIFSAVISVGDLLTSMPSLATLGLSGSWQAIYACFLNRTYDSLRSLSISIDTNSPRPPLIKKKRHNRKFSHIVEAFPGIRSFTLVLSDMDNFLTISDLFLLRERPLETLELRNLPASLSDVTTILDTWPLLKRLCIVPPAAHPFECEASTILSHISNHAPKLQRLDLPLDFSTFLRTPIPPPLRICPLLELDLSQAESFFPEDFRGKLAFCRKITSVLPRLTTVTSSSESNSGAVRDLQAAIDLVRDFLSSPPERHDYLFF